MRIIDRVYGTEPIYRGLGRPENKLYCPEHPVYPKQIYIISKQ
jgi:hypothetical protein